MYARLGANVVVNDVSEKGASAVVDEIVKAGGKAAAAVCSAEDGEKIVQVALEKFGGVHVLIANAGILRDKSFQSMSEKEWDDVIAVHLRGTYKVRLFFSKHLSESVKSNAHLTFISALKRCGQSSKNRSMDAS